MITFTADQLYKLAPVARANLVQALIRGVDDINAAGINTPLRFQHFISNVAVETNNLKAIEENLSYTAERIAAVWPTRFKNAAAAKAYARNPKALANKVYGGRLGNYKANDGWDFRGSSMIQTTGRSNFARAGFADDPDALRNDPDKALKAALKFWVDNNCNSFADRDDGVGLRKRINGGKHGLDLVLGYLKKAKTIFTSVPVFTVATKSKDEILELQQLLVDAGYVKVGKIDGYIGRDTIGAISSFQAENALTVNGTFDAATVEALRNTPPGALPDTRVGEVPSESRIIKGSRLLKKGAVGLLTTAGMSEAVEPLSTIEFIGDKVSRIKSAIEPFKGAVQFIQDHPVLLVVAGAAAVWFISKMIEKARIEDHQTGKTA
jgi:putative chitinase